MIWFFLALSALALGLNMEYRTKNYPPLRPVPTTDLVWKAISSLAGVWLVVVFVWSFFVMSWWAVPLMFIGAATFGGIFYGFVSRAAAAPAISMVLMIGGGIATGLTLYHLQVTH